MKGEKSALIAMSGGVDSSVAAYLARESGYNCIGATMKLFSGEEDSRCCSLDDAEDARSVAHRLGIKHYVFNFSDHFTAEVIDRFVAEYERGGTPNPCIDCNKYLKFGAFFARARELDCDYVVTGHYARIEYSAESGRFLLKKAADEQKDQSYVLYALTQEQLGHVFLPLGGLTKPQVREIAEREGFVNADKSESQDICFVPDGDYGAFIERYTGRSYAEGDFTDGEGRVLGRHRGIIRYTVGQRRGLGLSAPEPMYVCGIDSAANRVILGKNSELYSKKFAVRDINLISVSELSAPARVKVKVRYRQKEQWATAVQTAADRIEIEFDEPQRAITRGQAAVMYDGDSVVGGGTIDGVL